MTQYDRLCITGRLEFIDKVDTDGRRTDGQTDRTDRPENKGQRSSQGEHEHVF